jgi:hypothetical protein
MPNSEHTPAPAPYPSSGDFHRIFDEQIDGLYLLSFLLTGDREKAEPCFVSELRDSAPGIQSSSNEHARGLGGRSS